MSAEENLLRAGYMEATVPFRCGTCRYATSPPRGANSEVLSGKAGFCTHPEVESVVDAKLGCCNHFNPEGQILFGRPT